MKTTAKKCPCPPFGYAYEQDDGSWVVPDPDKESSIKFKSKISKDKRVITIIPAQPIRPVEGDTLYVEIKSSCP